jgi:hypothetical protein
VAVHIIDLVAQQKENQFPDLRKIVVDYDLDFSGSCLTLNVVSAFIPDLR